jgi:hypothetical protein
MIPKAIPTIFKNKSIFKINDESHERMTIMIEIFHIEVLHEEEEEIIIAVGEGHPYQEMEVDHVTYDVVNLRMIGRHDVDLVNRCNLIVIEEIEENG